MTNDNIRQEGFDQAGKELAALPDPTPALPEEQVIEELAKLMCKNHGRIWHRETEVIQLSYKGLAGCIITKLHSLGYERVDRAVHQGKTEQHIDDVIGGCIYQINNKLVTSAGIVRAIRDAFKEAGYRSPSEVQEAEQATPVKELERVIASAELRNPGKYNASRERYLAEISFKAGEQAAMERGIRKGIRWSYEEMKAQHYVIDYDLDMLVVQLTEKYGESELLGEQGK